MRIDTHLWLNIDYKHFLGEKAGEKGIGGD
jgi:hypothetical protein